MHEERLKLAEVIASLEQLEQIKAAAKPFLKGKRGRKFMDEAGRKEAIIGVALAGGVYSAIAEEPKAAVKAARAE